MPLQPYLSQIAPFGFGFAPKGWAPCAGQLLPINQNQALFALLGTTYGGDGRTTFALPDLRGRVAIGAGQGAGLSGYVIGQTGGSESITLGLTQMAAHTHAIDASALTATEKCRGAAGNQRTPVGDVPAIEAAGVTATYSNAIPDASMNSGAVAMGGNVTSGIAGQGVAHENRQPYLAVTYCIALQGVFPSQN
jgi:microcystin-dependent protein